MRLRQILLGSGLATILFFSTNISSFISLAVGQELPPAIDAGPDGVLFAIGIEDGDRAEFQKFDWEGINEYECTVGINCESSNFPAHLLRMSVIDRWDYRGVAQVTINFNLNQTCLNVFLRIVRAGSDTTIVNLDGRVSHYVTGKMLDSRSWYHYGGYDLDLGSLDAGVHNIKMTVDERGMGDGSYGWDAIILLVK
jgi:hypothetical protein